MFRKIVHTQIRSYKVSKPFLRFFSESAENEGIVSPLSGVRILDLSRIVAGPFCTMILGDLGADIIKVENPNGGDEARNFAYGKIRNESVYFMSINRNKKSVVIDLKKPQGRELLKELIKKSDVLVENFVPGKMAQFGLDYDTLKAIAPGLIYCSISGFGQTGPYKTRPGVDIIAASIGGLLHITGPEGGEPCTIGVPLTDIATGLYAHGAIMAALLQRIKTNRGQYIDCDLLSSQVSILPMVASNYLNAGNEAGRYGSSSDAIAPYQAFKTKNGYLTIASVSDRSFQDLCKFMNVSELAKDPRFATIPDRVKHRKVLKPILENVFKTKTNEQWLEDFKELHLPYGPVNNMEGVFKDSQVIYNKLVCDVEHPTTGNIKVIRPAVTYSYAYNKVRLPPPKLGEHTEVVLSDVLSYSKEKLEELRQSNIVY